MAAKAKPLRVPATVDECDQALVLLRRELRLAKWGSERGEPFGLGMVRIRIDDVLDRRNELTEATGCSR